jgi:hypothetical protein
LTLPSPSSYRLSLRPFPLLLLPFRTLYLCVLRSVSADPLRLGVPLARRGCPLRRPPPCLRRDPNRSLLLSILRADQPSVQIRPRHRLMGATCAGAKWPRYTVRTVRRWPVRVPGTYSTRCERGFYLREAPARSALLENFGLLWPPRTKSVIQFALPGAPQALGALRTNHSFGRFAPVSHFLCASRHSRTIATWCMYVACGTLISITHVLTPHRPQRMRNSASSFTSFWPLCLHDSQLLA